MAWDVFKRVAELRPSAMATVADRRFDDAVALAETGENARANGVVYLAGFVVEILLKARLVDRFPSVARKRQHELQPDDREVWSLIWRRHDLASMLERMPELEAALDRSSARAGVDYSRKLKAICATWSIYARYSTQTMQMDEARAWLEDVKLIKETIK